MRMLALGVVLAALLAPARRAVATITEIDLADIPEPVSRAALEVDDAANANPGDGSPFTSWVESGITLAPAEGELGYFGNGNGSNVGMRFAQTGGFGNGTAVIVFDDPASHLAVEGGYSQNHMHIALFADWDGLEPIGDLLVAESEGPPGLPTFVVSSTDSFLRAEVQDADALGELGGSNLITDLQFHSVPEPSRAMLAGLAAAALSWLWRRR